MSARRTKIDEDAEALVNRLAAEPLPNGNGQGSNGASRLPAGKPRLVTRVFSEIEVRGVTWIWEKWIPLGMLTLLEGDPGLGKSNMTIDWAARISRGWPMPLSNFTPEPMNVAFIASEDAAENVIAPRLKAAGADLARVHMIDSVRLADGTEKLIVFPDDLPLIEEFLTEKEIRFLVVDPIFGHTSTVVDTHKDASVREMLNQVKIVAERTGTAIVALRHLNKSGGGNAMYRGGGSIAVGASARSVIAVGKHPERQNTYVLTSVKLNLALKPKSITYGIETRDGQPLIGWGYECDLTADDLCIQSKSRDGVKDDAVDFLRDLLAGGAVRADEIEKKAQAAGISESTLRRAKKSLDVRSKRTGFSDATWVWELPVPVTVDVQTDDIPIPE